MKKIFSSIDYKISSIYLFFSCLWIFFSDRIVNAIAPDLRTVTEFQTGKGLFFVLVSSILIYFLLHSYIRKEKEANSVIRENAEKFSSIYQMSYDAILLTSPKDGLILSANPAACKLLGMTEDEICSGGPYGIVEPTDTRLKNALQEREKTGHFFTGLRLVKKDGTILECEISSTIFTSKDGKILSSMVVREVTDRVKAQKQLLQSEERFSAIFMKSAYAASLSTADDSCYVEVNDMFENIFGYSRSEAIGKTAEELNILPDQISLKEILTELQESGKVRNARIELFTKSGERRVMSMNLDLIEIGGEKFALNTAQDITVQERLIDELKRSEENLKETQRFAHLGNWTWTIPTNKVEWSDEMYTILGISKDTFTGNLSKVISSVVHPDDQVGVQEMVNQVIKHKNLRPFFNRIVMPDKTVKTVWAENGELVLDQNGQPFKLSGIVQDITERVKFEEKINIQANALEAAANAIIITDIHGTIIWANSAFSQLTGYSEDEYLGNNTRILNSSKQSKEFYSELWDTILAGTVWHKELINRHKDGHLYYEEETITPIRDNFGFITHFVGIKQDISERVESEKRIKNLLAESQRRLKRLQSLRDIDSAINSNYILDLTLTIVMEIVKEQLSVDGVVVLLYDESIKAFHYGGSVGFTSQRIKNAHVNLGDSLAGKAAKQVKIIQLQNIHEPIDPHFKSLMDEEHLVDYYGIPIISKGNIIGVLELFSKSLLSPDAEWIEYFETLAGQTAIAIENARLIEGLKKSNSDLINSYDATIEGWSKALDLRDKETEGHTQRVTDLTIALAKQFGFTDDQIVHLRRGALLHDIGKMGIPDAVLAKPGVLSPEERKIMEQHPTLAYEMLVNIDYLQPALEIPCLHHERWDGSGYPKGLKGMDIPLSARMFAVIDVFDALTSDRPYRAAWSKEKTIDYLLSESGRQFDPDVVTVFLNYIRQVS